MARKKPSTSVAPNGPRLRAGNASSTRRTDNPIPQSSSSVAIGLRSRDPYWLLQACSEDGTAHPFVPSKAGTQNHTDSLESCSSLDPRVRGDERSEGSCQIKIATRHGS